MRSSNLTFWDIRFVPDIPRNVTVESLSIYTGNQSVSGKGFCQTIQDLRLQLKSDNTIEDLTSMFRPVTQGGINYYCKFHPSAFNSLANYLDRFLAR
jgi:RNA-directed DNA polymerase